ncbi:hypothetical protein ADEAN_000135500 [Angomonas deanei]|uniref:RNA recognition motif. (A.k.a. RRM, RBD, or RNP domain) n=1 Tax=Angomonas deanei TaxID=59799 RepID=A0A7G2C413_9TRYP|nr:hypothetical protein ADEAN_000135500 [Angomonas deanei]
MRKANTNNNNNNPHYYQNPNHFSVSSGNPHFTQNNRPAFQGGHHNQQRFPHSPERLHQDYKSLSKDEKLHYIHKEVENTDLLQRTLHLRFLPYYMLQSDLAALCKECGEYLRVRICGNNNNNNHQNNNNNNNGGGNNNWIYGFVEFRTVEGADNMMKKSGMLLPNPPCPGAPNTNNNNNNNKQPFLRLKCNAAKQPIVDRVFHDADIANNNPCIFGLGNFANKTLKDALDSYFNLKAKEKEKQQKMYHGNNTNRFYKSSPNTALPPHPNSGLHFGASPYTPNSTNNFLFPTPIVAGDGLSTPTRSTAGKMVNRYLLPAVIS